MGAERVESLVCVKRSMQRLEELWLSSHHRSGVTVRPFSGNAFNARHHHQGVNSPSPPCQAISSGSPCLNYGDWTGRS